jgi:hypothetical protein
MVLDDFVGIQAIAMITRISAVMAQRCNIRFSITGWHPLNGGLEPVFLDLADERAGG